MSLNKRRGFQPRFQQIKYYPSTFFYIVYLRSSNLLLKQGILFNINTFICFLSALIYLFACVRYNQQQKGQSTLTVKDIWHTALTSECSRNCVCCSLFVVFMCKEYIIFKYILSVFFLNHRK